MHGWHCHMSLCKAALASLAGLCTDLVAAPRANRTKRVWRPQSALIRIVALVPSVPEIEYLLARITIQPSTRKPLIPARSLWRR